MSALLIEIHYLPCLSYFVELMKHDRILLEASENFQKQTYRNRCFILGANKTEQLTVPIVHRNTKTAIQSVEIDYSQPWQKVHWKAIQSAYGKAAYYEYFADYLKQVYDKKPKLLWELNLDLLTVCLKLMGIEKKIEFTQEYNKVADIPVKDINDKRSLIHPKRSYDRTDIRYTQVFGVDFVPDLSIIDLIFNEGNNSRALLREVGHK